jgi:hypothetical protein
VCADVERERACFCFWEDDFMVYCVRATNPLQRKKKKNLKNVVSFFFFLNLGGAACKMKRGNIIRDLR